MVSRRNQDGAVIRRMVSVRDHVNADVTVPIPQLTGEPTFEMLAPQLVADGIEFNALRAGGPMPNASFPSLTQTDKSRNYADIRQRAVYASWHQSQLPILLYRAFRQLVGYGTCAFKVVPDFERAKKGRGGAKVEIADPLTAYPELRAAEDIRPPSNVGFVNGKAPDWIVSHYPEARELIYGHQRKSAENETLWDMVEWIDEDQIVVGILGPRSLYMQAPSSLTPSDGRDDLHAGGMQLRRWDNHAGMVPVAIPRRVTLDRIAGQLDSIIPLQEWMGKIMALEVAAAEKGVLPDTVAIGEPDRQPQLVGGQWHDGRTGKINLLQNVRAIQQLQAGPSPQSTLILDRLERNARISGGISAFGGGETPSSLRTGRAIDAMSGFSVDPRIQEIQTIMAYSLQAVNQGIIAVEKGYWPKRKFVAFSGWPADRGLVEYTPEKHFESDENVVTYTFPGSDVSEITVGVSQLVASDLMSRHTGRDKHPHIDDPEGEERRIREERISTAISMAYQQKLIEGTLDIEAAVDYLDFTQQGMTEVEAWRRVQAAAQERQAAQQQQMAMPTGGPEEQPGVNAPPSMAPPSDGQQNLQAMIQAISAGT